MVKHFFPDLFKMILSGYQVMVRTFAAQRPTLCNIWNEVFPVNGPEPKSLIEISGASGTGKSILLYELMARASLSTVYGGKYCQIIFVDLSHKFDLSGFIKFIQNAMNKNSVICSQRSLENPLKYCESIIHLPCYSVDQFQLAIRDFESILWDYKRVSLIAIDGLDTFYWDECYIQLQRMSTHYKKIIQRLKPLCKEHNICCAFTVDENYLTVKSKTRPLFPHSLIDYKLKLSEQKNGHHYLNDAPIKLNFDGIELLKK